MPPTVHPARAVAGAVVVLLAVAAVAPAQVVLNEIMPVPGTDWTQNGIYSSSEDEWIELVVPGPDPVDVGGWFVTDDVGPGAPRIGLDGVLAPGEHVLLTGEMSVDWETEHGVSAVGLSLNNSGGVVSLFRVASGETTLVDTVEYAASDVAPDVSLGRLPDATGDWSRFDALAPGGAGPQPTPGGTNGGIAGPKILGWDIAPSFPTSGDAITVTAVAGDADGIAECRLMGEESGVGPWTVAMDLVDGTEARGTWETALAPRPAGTVLSVKVRVSDGALLEETNPVELTIAGADAPVVLNEILADPAADLEGDANGDGIRDGSDDEFVEIINRSTAPVDLTGWRLEDATGVRHEFAAGPVLDPGALFVVFGGGDPTGIPSAWDVASTGGLSLNNTSDEVRLVGDDDVPRDVHAYGSEANADQSLVRLPDGDGEWTRPGDVGYAWRFSPGLRNESAFSLEAASWARVKALYRD